MSFLSMCKEILIQGGLVFVVSMGQELVSELAGHLHA